MAFNPDAYLAKKSAPAFDPDAYLASKGATTTPTPEGGSALDSIAAEGAKMFKGIGSALGGGIGATTGLGMVGEMAGRAVGANPRQTLKVAPHAMGALGGSVGLMGGGPPGAAVGAGILGSIGAGLSTVNSALMDKNTYKNPLDAIANLSKEIGPAMINAATTQASQEIIGRGVGKVAQGVVWTLGKGIELSGDIAKAGHRSLLAWVKSSSGKVIDRTLDFADDMTPDALEASKKFLDTVNKLKTVSADKLTKAKSLKEGNIAKVKETFGAKMAKVENTTVSGATEEDVADQAVVYAQTLRSEAFKKAEEARSLLNPEPTIEADSIIADINDVRQKLTVKGEAFGESENAVATLDRWAEKIKRITQGKPDVSRVPKDMLGPDGNLLPELAEEYGGLVTPTPNVPLSEVELKGLLRGIKGDAVWKGPADQSIKQALRELYDKISSNLDANKAYRAALNPVHSMIKTAKEIEQAFSLKRGADRVISQTDATIGRVKGMIAGTRAASESVAKKSGLGQILDSAKSRVATSESRDLALKTLRKQMGVAIKTTADEGTRIVKEATKAAGVKYADDVSILNMARAAIREGSKSGTYLKLTKTLSAVLGKKEGVELAHELVTSAAKDIFTEGVGGAFPGGFLRLTMSGLRNAPLAKLKAVDGFFQGVIDAGFKTQSFGAKFPGRGLTRIIAAYKDKEQ